MIVLPEMRQGTPGLTIPGAPRMVRPSAYEDIAISLVEKATRLDKAVSEVMATSPDADIDITKLKEEVVSLRTFIPELSAANLRAAVEYMANKKSLGAEEEAVEITHKNKDQIHYIAGFLSWIERGLNLESPKSRNAR
jgi:hypothetical protein